VNNKSKHDDYYSPIDLSHIFEDNDTLKPWTCELEGPLLDRQEKGWLEEALAEEDEHDTVVARSSFRHYDDDDDIYVETHAIFYTHDVYAGDDATRDDVTSVSGSGIVGETTTREIGSDGDGGGGGAGVGVGAGDPIIVGGSSTPCGFTEYDSRFVSTQDTIMAFDLHRLSVNDPVVLLIVGDNNIDMDTLMMWRNNYVPWM